MEDAILMGCAFFFVFFIGYLFGVARAYALYRGDR